MSVVACFSAPDKMAVTQTATSASRIPTSVRLATSLTALSYVDRWQVKPR
jgi:hypothetical protein